MNQDCSFRFNVLFVDVRRLIFALDGKMYLKIICSDVDVLIVDC